MRSLSHRLRRLGQFIGASRGGGRFLPWALIVLELDRGAVAMQTFFLDTATLFPRFGLPMELPLPESQDAATAS